MASDINAQEKQPAPAAETLLDVLRVIFGLRPSRPGRLKPRALDRLAESLAGAFQDGLPVVVNPTSTWYATLDALTPQDNEVAALARLSLHPPEQPTAARRGMIAAEQRGRTLFEAPFSSGPTKDDDLLLSYSFPAALALGRNLQFFKEFAANEVRRLRLKEPN